MEFRGGVTATKTSKTEDEYRKRYRGFVRMVERAEVGYSKDTQTDVHDIHAKVVECFLRTRGEYSPASVRLNLAAIVFVLDESVQGGDIAAYEAKRTLLDRTDPVSNRYRSLSAAERSEAAEELERIAEAQKSRKAKLRTSRLPGKTSQQKAKVLTAEKINALIGALVASRSKWAADTINWFRAGCLTGLRPNEWPGSEIVDFEGVIALRVRNGKFSNGRAPSEWRHLLLHKADAAQLEVIKAQVARANEIEARGGYPEWYHNCRQELRLKVTRLWPTAPKHPSLYSTRHVFAANAKSRLTQREVAAAMGHGSDVSSTRHYAPRRSAPGGFTADPSDLDLAVLQQRNGDPKDVVRPPEKSRGDEDGR
ncbi:hypothetical protein ACSFA0_23485 [Variovorax sp. LT1P1]|uniref:hypothetical protein n=1 Tax=Variovorax sp. LT1P1 TaxID=3443730 RepID=UPI003F446305